LRTLKFSDLLDPLLASAAAAPGTVASPPHHSTGSTDLDTVTGGLCEGDLWVVTGRSGSGKSVLALGFARSAAIRSRVPTGHVRARDRAEDLVAQVLSAEGRIPLHYLRDPLTDNDRTRAASLAARVADMPLWMSAAVDYGNAALPTADQLLATAAALVEERAPELLVVDDLPAMINSSQLQELKSLAVRGRTCVVAVVLDGPERLRDAVEQDAAVAADVVLRVVRDHDMTPSAAAHPRAGEADLLVVRHRRGPIAAVTVAFQGHYARFVDMPAVR
jgi:replicative DNA helicase